MGGKSKGGPVGPTPQEEYNLAKSYWQEYGQWSAQEKANLEKDLSTYRAQAAASGGVGSEMYDKLAADRQAKYDEAMKGLEQGERGRSLKGWEKDMRNSMRSQYDLGKWVTEMDSDSGSSRRSYQMNGRGGGVFGRALGKANGNKFGQFMTMDAETKKLVDRGNELNKKIGEYDYQKSQNQDGYNWGFGRNQKDPFEAERAELTNIQSQLSAKQAEIDNLSMEELYARQFGEQKVGPGSKEEQALERAKSYGGGRKAPSGGSSAAQPSAFFGGSEDGTGWW